jgi:hypothetical protein
MRTLWVALLAVGMVMLATASRAPAQYPQYYQRPGFNTYSGPALSPYLNLLRGGSPSANYYLGVLPEFDRRAKDLQFRTEIQDLERRTAMTPETGELGPLLPETGHPSYFANYGSYYNLNAISRPNQLTAPITPPRRGR